MTYNNKYSAYTTATHMVRKTKQVVMLYDGAIRYVQQAKAAIEEKRIEDRYNALVKACDIITGLQLSLDFENGGEVAKVLYDYYAGIDMRLLSVHQSESTEICDLCIKHLKMMREAWDEIDHSNEIIDAKDKEIDIIGGYNSNNDYDSDINVDFSNPKFARPLMEATSGLFMTA